MSEVTERPHPVLRGEEKVFYDALREHRLVYQRCAECGDTVFPLRTVCPHCGEEALSLEVSTGVGRVYSFTTQHRAASPLFASAVPYTLVLVDLDEGFRVLTSAPQNLPVAVGAPVRIVFEDVDADLTVLSVAAAHRDQEEQS